MAYTINIEIEAALQDSWLVHRLLNFKEDLHREFVRNGQAVIADIGAIDRALDPLTITIASKRSLSSVTAFISKSLLRHDVAEAVRMTRVK